MDDYSQRLLVVRLSALGDVAILEPVLRMRAAANPEVLFLLAAPPRLEPLFAHIPNVQYVPTQKRQSSKQLYRQLSALEPTQVADMHHVNRVIGCDWLFMLHGVKVRSIRKHSGPDRPSWKRYDEVFERCGLKSTTPSLSTLSRVYWQPKQATEGLPLVGIAPFAQHEGKIWPIGRMEALVGRLSESGLCEVLLFGSKEEAEVMRPWAAKYERVACLAGTMTFAEELQQIGRLNVMVSMDSSNMHFASCLGVPVVSIWGATHAGRGFYGWRQEPSWRVEADMGCRPCSKYGNKPCRKGDYPCMKAVTVEQVYEKVTSLLH